MLFASAGYKVIVYDILQEQVEKAKEDIALQINTLESKKLLRGKLNGQEQISLISGEFVKSYSYCYNNSVILTYWNISSKCIPIKFYIPLDLNKRE